MASEYDLTHVMLDVDALQLARDQRHRVTTNHGVSLYEVPAGTTVRIRPAFPDAVEKLGAYLGRIGLPADVSLAVEARVRDLAGDWVRSASSEVTANLYDDGDGAYMSLVIVDGKCLNAIRIEVRFREGAKE